MARVRHGERCTIAAGSSIEAVNDDQVVVEIVSRTGTAQHRSGHPHEHDLVDVDQMPG
jgi:hypothetical protein